MKSFILATVSSVALLAAGAAFAAPISPPVPPSEIPGATSVASEITQSGQNEYASVDQSGSAGALGTLSTVNQSGSKNSATVTESGTKDVSSIVQTQSGNNATVTQDARFTSEIEQDGTNGTAVVKQHYAQDGVASDSSIFQHSGSKNYASVTQFDDGSKSTVDQTASNNNATVDQAYNATSTITQTKGGQYANVHQATGYMTSTVVQGGQYGGTGNQAYVNQGLMAPGYQSSTSTVSQFDNSSQAHVDQSDYLGKSTITQGADLGITVGGFSLSLPPGSNNYASAYQTGGYDQSTIGQYGSNNTAELSQAAGANINSTNASDIEQIGNSNTAYVTQTGAHGTSSVIQGAAGAFGTTSGQYASVVQSGSTDSSKVSQLSTAGAQYAYVTQTGSNDTSIVDQNSLNGQNNTADVGQKLNYAFSHVSQTGMSNYAFVRQ